MTDLEGIDEEGGWLSLEDFHNAQNVTFLQPTTENENSFNALNESMLYEGDIVYDNTDDIGDNVNFTSDTISEEKYKWTTKNGPFLIVPVAIPQGLSDQDKAQIAKAIWEFRSKTCIK